MKHPQNCEECPYCDTSGYTCNAFEVLKKDYTYEVPENGILDKCPLINCEDKQGTLKRIIERLESASWNTQSTFDHDGYCNDDSDCVVSLYDAIKIIEEEGGLNE